MIRDGVRAWLRRNQGRLGIIFAEVLSLHILLLAALVIVPSSSPAQNRPGSNYETIRKTIGDLSRNPDNPGLSESLKDKIDSLAGALDQKIKFDDRIDKAQKAEIILYMIRSFLRLRDTQGGAYLNVQEMSMDEIQALIEQSTSVRLKSGETAFSSRGADASDGFFFSKLDKSREAQIKRLRGNENLEKAAAGQFGDQVRVKAASYSRTGMRSIPAEVYFRKCPYERILARGASLFSIVRGFPALGMSPRPQSAGMPKTADGKARVQAPANDLLAVYIIHPTRISGTEASVAAGATSEFSAQRMDQILDELMVMPEGKQFLEFEKDYLRRFDPNSEELARLARRFVSVNLNGLFYYTDDFSMAFDFVEELYYKRPIYEALAAYGRLHPGTKTAGEFLFSLADAYDFERRALLFLSAVRNDASEILSNRSRRTSAFDYKAKAYVLDELAGEVFARLKDGGFPSPEIAARRYREESIALYRILEGFDGEIRNRARFALGQLFWEDGETRQAMDVWAAIDPHYPSRAFQLIRPYLEQTRDALSAAVPKIGEVLNNEAEAGNGSLLRRQLKFHKWTIRAETAQ
jgi:hypothetical protein